MAGNRAGLPGILSASWRMAGAVQAGLGDGSHGWLHGHGPASPGGSLSRSSCASTSMLIEMSFSSVALSLNLPGLLFRTT